MRPPTQSSSTSGWKFVIPGRPATKKNRPILIGGDTPRILPSAEYRAWERRAVAALQAQGLNRAGVPESTLLGLEVAFYLGFRHQPDLPGLLEAVFDALQKAKVLRNDYWIEVLEPRPRRVWPPRGGSKSVKAAREAWRPRVEGRLYVVVEP